MEDTIPRTAIRELLQRRIKEHLAEKKERAPFGGPFIQPKINEVRWIADQLDIAFEEIEKMDYEEAREKIAEELTWHYFEKKEQVLEFEGKKCVLQSIFYEVKRDYLQYDLETLKQKLKEK